MISVVIPTISGREHHLERCLLAYERFTGPHETIIVRNKPTCGLAWEEGGKRAKGHYIHFTADDLEPHEGWWKPAVECVNEGMLPCPRIYTPEGAIESCGQWGVEQPDGSLTNIARIPFLSRKHWELGGWTIPLHYYTDNQVAHRGRELGIPTVVKHGFDFTHYYAPEGRLDTMDADLVAYQGGGGTF